MRWRLILEEFGLTLHYIKGTQNVVADALSRLDKEENVAHQLCNLEMLSDEEYTSNYGNIPVEELYAFDGNDLPDSFPLEYGKIAHYQEKDQDLQKQFTDSDLLKKKSFKYGDHSYELITRKDKICVPKDLQIRAADWYHGLLMHPGEKRTLLTLGQHFYWKNMDKTVRKVCQKCPTCQLTKKKQKKYGVLPPKDTAEAIPWNTLCIDLIGPYKIGQPEIKNKYGKVTQESTETTLHCLTMIDPATGWFEIAEIPNKRADEISNILEKQWLLRYPWPTILVTDRCLRCCRSICRRHLPHIRVTFLCLATVDS